MKPFAPSRTASVSDSASLRMESLRGARATDVMGPEEKVITTSHALRESQKLIAIGQMTAEIAHEINNPLEAIGNLLYLAQHEPGIPFTAAEYLREAEKQLQRVVQISKQTLSFSRESAEPVALQLTALMDEVVSMYSRRMAQKQLSVMREYDLDTEVLALPGEIRQVMSNLVANAIEACSNGGRLRLRIRSTTHSKIASEPGIRMSIGDNGSGITEAARAKLGQIFFTTKGHSGTGLGLWITNSIVASHGGTLRLRSSVGERHGTVFSVFLPGRGKQRVDGHAGDTSVDVDSEKEQDSQKILEISRHPKHSNHTSQARTSRDAAPLDRQGRA